MAAVDSLTSELAFKANVAAVSRDYICEPHLGEKAIVPSKPDLLPAAETVFVPRRVSDRWWC